MPAIPDPPEPKASTEPTPPTRQIRQDITSPNQKDGFYVELVDITDSSLQAVIPIKRGTPYATILGADQRIIDQYSGNPLYFLKQTADLMSMRVRFNGQYDNYVLWIWATDSLAQNSYNSGVTYLEEAQAFPRYVRVSTVRRKNYDTTPAISYQSALTCLTNVVITNPGTGYTFATGVVATGAEVTFVILAGALVDCIVTKEGTAVTANASITITGDGTGGAAAAKIQPATALLVSQSKKELPDEDPLSHDYVQITRIYETLPGPLLTEYDQDEQTQVNIKTTYQVLAGAAPAPSSGNGILTTNKKIDSQKYLQIIRDFTAFLPFSFDEQKFAADQLPALLDFSTYVYTDACGAFSQLRSATSIKMQVRTHVTYTATKQVIAGLVLFPKSLMLGKGFQINQQVLVDDYTYTYTGTCTGTASGTGSSPTYSDYIANIEGTEQLVAGESVLWKAGIYRNTYVYETFPAPPP